MGPLPSCLYKVKTFFTHSFHEDHEEMWSEQDQSKICVGHIRGVQRCQKSVTFGKLSEQSPTFSKAWGVNTFSGCPSMVTWCLVRSSCNLGFVCFISLFTVSLLCFYLFPVFFFKLLLSKQRHSLSFGVSALQG